MQILTNDDAHSPPALAIESVSHNYGRARALADVSLDVHAGTFTVLLGVNGAGKTTLFNLITRLFGTQAGRIAVCGFDLDTNPAEALARLGVVFQSRALDGNLTVAQNLIYQGALYGIGRKAALARGEVLLDQIGMSEQLGDKVARLSGGQQRRVEIARALLHSPKLILCDEATVGLDVKARTDIVADMHRLAHKDGIGVLWTTHLIDEIAPEDPVYVLHQGAIRATGNATDIAGDGTLSDAFLALTKQDAA